MIETAAGLAKETWKLLNEMAPYLLFGFMVAGILRILIPNEKIYGHLSKNNLSSVIKAALFGVPLPLCSCGVIPVAAHLRKEGASKSSTISFLIATPTTGIDSILATYSLLGPLFAVTRILADLFAAIFSGTIINIFDKEEAFDPADDFSCTICDIDTPHTHGLLLKMKAMFDYAFSDLLQDTWKWLAIGIIAGGIISYLVPTELIENYLGRPGIAYPLMLLLGIPMYVCATGSIPIAASLVLKGMSPGAGLIFLIAGPATNTATISFVAGKLGKRTVFIYLTGIIVSALLFGYLMDYYWISAGKDMKLLSGGTEFLPGWLKPVSSVILIALTIKAVLFKKKEDISGMGIIFKVPDMTCNHCSGTIDSALRKISGVKDVKINLKTKEVEVTGDPRIEDLADAIKNAGYTMEDIRK